MYAATGGPNVKWGGTNFKWGDRAPLAPPLATTLLRALSTKSYNLRTINAQINIKGKKNTKVRHSRKTVSLYLNTAIGQPKSLLKLEHQTGVKTKQMNCENSPVR